MIRTGIFSGSFNPVHIGHLALANYLCEYEGLDEVWFLITPLNPHKQKHELMDNGLRLEMVRKAIDGYPKFRASDFEFSLPRPSYTINTLSALKKAYPEHIFHFIMGADNWNGITRWKNYSKLLEEYPILIYPRNGFPIDIPSHYPNIRKVDAPLIEISSTFIRDSIRKGKDIRFFLPESVYAICHPVLSSGSEQK